MMQKWCRIVVILFFLGSSFVCAGGAGPSGQKSRTYYDILGVRQNATQAEIKQAFRALAMKFHPDKNPSLQATEEMKLINHAHDILSDSEKRREYDATLTNPSRPVFYEQPARPSRDVMSEFYDIPQAQPPRPSMRKQDPVEDRVFFKVVEAIKSGEVDAVRAAISYGFDVNSFDQEVDDKKEGGYGNRVLHHAVEGRNKEIISVLLNAGANPNVLDAEKTTPFIEYFAKNKVTPGLDETIVRLFLEKGADVSKRGGAGTKALDYVDKVKYPRIYKMLYDAEKDGARWVR